MAVQKRTRKIDLSSLFPEDDSASSVEISLDDEITFLTYIPPTHLTLSLRDNVCRHCGSVERETLGIFLEYHDRKTMRLSRIPKESTLGQFSYLPRRVDYAPPDSLPACSLCWFTNALVAAADSRGTRGINETDATPCSHTEVTPL